MRLAVAGNRFQGVEYVVQSQRYRAAGLVVIRVCLDGFTRGKGCGIALVYDRTFAFAGNFMFCISD